MSAGIQQLSLFVCVLLASHHIGSSTAQHMKLPGGEGNTNIEQLVKQASEVLKKEKANISNLGNMLKQMGSLLNTKVGATKPLDDEDAVEAGDEFAQRSLNPTQRNITTVLERMRDFMRSTNPWKMYFVETFITILEKEYPAGLLLFKALQTAFRLKHPVTYNIIKLFNTIAKNKEPLAYHLAYIFDTLSRSKKLRSQYEDHINTNAPIPKAGWLKQLK